MLRGNAGFSSKIIPLGKGGICSLLLIIFFVILMTITKELFNFVVSKTETPRPLCQQAFHCTNYHFSDRLKNSLN